MKTLVAVLAFMMLTQAHAQAPQNAEAVVVQQPGQAAPQGAPQAQKRVVAYDEQRNQLVEPQSSQASAGSNSGAGVSSPIYILNNQNQKVQQGTKQDSAQIQESPTTVVQEAPLKISAGDQIRKRRQNEEASTEDGIVQALEQIRMQDELKRREKFNNAIITPTETKSAVVAAPQAPNNSGVVVQTIPTQVSTQTQTVTINKSKQVDESTDVVADDSEVVVVEKPQKRPSKRAEVRTEERVENTIDVRNEIRAEVNEFKRPETRTNNYYVSGLLGLGKYPDIVNVRGNATGGVAVGASTSEHVVAEVSFLAGDYDLEDVYGYMYNYTYFPRIVQMRQYNIGAAAKYQLPFGKIRPAVGVVGNYVRRSYSEQMLQDFRTSDAFDLGATASLDVQVTDTLALGIDFRYMTNVYFRHNTRYPDSIMYPQERNQIEKLDYYVTTATAKFTF